MSTIEPSAPSSRRGFIASVAGVSATALAADLFASRPAAGVAAVARAGAGVGKAPVVISSANGFHPDGATTGRRSAIPVALAKLNDPAIAKAKYGLLEALVDGVAEPENDPEETGVGLGGLPNEAGVVQLDASCMFGPTHQAGSVGAIENIQNPARAAMYVLRYTDHCMLVGKGAYDFARAHGMPHAELLTEKARRIWLYWKQANSERDDWTTPPDEEVAAEIRKAFTQGTIHMSGVDAKGDLCAVTTTSGLSYKISGRLGDSPIIGAGTFCDNEVGAAGGTGRGEEMIVNAGAHSMVEAMRAGRDPVDACLDLLKRVATNAKKRGLVKDGKPTFGLTVYALRKDGAYGSASLRQGDKFAVGDAEKGPRREACAWLFDA